MNDIGYYFYQIQMRFLLRYIIYLILSLFIAVPATAQVPDAAAKKFNEAMRLRNKRQDSLAYKTMEEAIKAHSTYVDAYSTLGEWYFTDRKYTEASDVFVRASQRCRNGQSAFALPLARSLLYDYKPAQALNLIVANERNATNKEWEELRRNAEFMRAALAKGYEDTVYNIGMRINTPYPEMYPAISADTQTLYFTRKVRNVDMEFYKSTEDSCGGWFTGRNMGSPTNTPNHEAAQSISADGHYMFFMRCDNRSENGWDQGGCDLYMSYTADSVWSVAESFGATINTPAYEGMPCLSPDNRDLYFVSDRDGGYGGLDIWVSRFQDGLWQEPRNLGPHINTNRDETAPFLHIDNRTLYFSSNGLTGLGGSDLYHCRRIDDTLWGKPVNMGYPVNTTANETSISVTIDGSHAYLSSDRDSLEGNYDIYETDLPEDVAPVQVAVLNGYTYDSLIKGRLNNTSVFIEDAATGEFLYRFVSNRGDGSYMITLPVGRDYVYTAKRYSYLDMTDTIRLANVDSSILTAIPYNIPLLPNDYVAPIHDSLIATIHFPKNSYLLTDSDKTTLRRAFLPWIGDDSYTVLIHGYTDNTGTPLINEELSALRAQLVTQEITTYGVNEYAIRTSGWGETNPVASNDTEYGRELNRRVEVIIRR